MFLIYLNSLVKIALLACSKAVLSSFFFLVLKPQNMNKLNTAMTYCDLDSMTGYCSCPATCPAVYALFLFLHFKSCSIPYVFRMLFTYPYFLYVWHAFFLLLVITKVQLHVKFSACLPILMQVLSYFSRPKASL